MTSLEIIAASSERRRRLTELFRNPLEVFPSTLPEVHIKLIVSREHSCDLRPENYASGTL